MADLQNNKNRAIRDLWWECQNCLNQAIAQQRPNTCHPRCGSPQWKLIKQQRSVIVGRDDWVHSQGEV